MRTPSAVLVLWAGCQFGTEGDLGTGSFVYLCTSDADPACEQGETVEIDDLDVEVTFSGTSSRLPEALAVGSQFAVSYEGPHPVTEDGYEVQVAVVSASPHRLEPIHDDTFAPREPGPAALIALGANGEVADFKHLQLVQPSTLRVRGPSGALLQELTMEAGKQRVLTVRAADTDSIELAGSAVCTWSSADEAVLSVEPGPGTAQATVYSSNLPGSTQLLVSCSHLDRTLDVEVQ